MTAKARADVEFALNTVPDRIIERPTSWSGHAILARGRHAFGLDNWEEPARKAIELLAEDIFHFNDYPYIRIAQLYLWAGQPGPEHLITQYRAAELGYDTYSGVLIAEAERLENHISRPQVGDVFELASLHRLVGAIEESTAILERLLADHSDDATTSAEALLLLGRHEDLDEVLTGNQRPSDFVALYNRIRSDPHEPSPRETLRRHARKTPPTAGHMRLHPQEVYQLTVARFGELTMGHS